MVDGEQDAASDHVPAPSPRPEDLSLKEVVQAREALLAATPEPDTLSDNPTYRRLKESGPKYRSSRAGRRDARALTLGRLLAVGEKINAREPYKDEIVYTPTFLINAPLPLKEPPDGMRLWTGRYNDSRGEIAVTYEAGTMLGPGGAEQSVGLPYGIYPRIILPWVISKALVSKNPVLTIVDPSPMAPRGTPNTFTSWMRDDLGVTPTGGAKGTIRLLREQMTRIFNMKITISINRKDTNLRILPIAGDRGFFDPAHTRGEKSEGPLELQMDRLFFVEILERSSPSRLAAQQELATLCASLALDLYRFLTVRQYHLKKSQKQVPEIIDWTYLHAVLGRGYARLDHFREALLDALELVLAIYPDARAEACRGGLRVRPSRPHVRIVEKSPRTIAAAAAASERP